jgi:hypothetical protein
MYEKISSSHLQISPGPADPPSSKMPPNYNSLKPMNKENGSSFDTLPLSSQLQQIQISQPKSIQNSASNNKVMQQPIGA